jgi:hypothetical protein
LAPDRLLMNQIHNSNHRASPKLTRTPHELRVFNAIAKTGDPSPHVEGV